MLQTPNSAPATVAIADLVKRCQSLCQSAEMALPHLPKERDTFLATSLGDVLLQLELVLRAVGQEPSDARRTEERKSFLRRLFNRSQVDENHSLGAPSFDVTRQGLQGNATTVSMAELLSFLALGRKTGALWVDSPQENFMIGLSGGNVVHAASDHAPEGLRLGETLVGMGFLTRRQLERFVGQTQDKQAQVAGEYLVQNGMISAEELQSALKQQVQKLVQRVVSTKTALFRFREGMEVLMPHHVSMDVNHLLLESARVHDETSNSELRSTAAAHSWSSWQEELSAEIAAVSAKPEAEQESSPAATPGATPEKSADS